jgi:DNA-binding IclR family transcriptional regulator
MASETGVGRAAGSQTLSRGIRILEALAAAGGPLRIDDLAAHLEVHRSVAYRLIRTLEEHGLVRRDAEGGVRAGAGLATLAAGVEPDLRRAAAPELSRAAADLGLTCFLAVRDGGECLTLVSSEPPRAVAVVAQRPGTRHSLAVGAPGKAILSLVPRREWPEDAVEDAVVRQVSRVAERGWAETHDEVISGLHAVAVPLALSGGSIVALAALYVGEDADEAVVAQRLLAAAEAVRTAG